MNRNKLEIACIFYDMLRVFLPCLIHPSFLVVNPSPGATNALCSCHKPVQDGTKANKPGAKDNKDYLPTWARSRNKMSILH